MIRDVRPAVVVALVVVVALHSACTDYQTADPPAASDDGGVGDAQVATSPTTPSEAGAGTDAASSSSSSSSSSGGGPGALPCVTAGVNLSRIHCAEYRRPCASEVGVDLFGSLNHTSDLVTCDANANPICVTHCPHGCAELPNGFSDNCDACNGLPDGSYCGKDMPTWSPDAANIALRCANGAALTTTNACTACNKAACRGTDLTTCCQ